jgi:beta-N-acetylhexosaminidase
MDLRSQVGQLLIMGFDGLKMSAKLRTMLQTMQPGGVILFARNIKEPRQTWELLRECRREVTIPMFQCVDMEGGTVDRLKNVIAPAPSVADIAVSGSRTLFRQHGRVIGAECRAMGFNTDFAPVVDLAFPPSKTVLTSRTVSDDPKQSVIYAREFYRGLKDVHVLGCGKHFPGLGEANLDTHHKLPAIDKPWKKLWEEDLYPYRTLHRQMPFVMVAHAAYTAVTKDKTPASVSKKWITDVLRKKVGYKGLIISDDLEMGGVQAAMKIGEAAVACIKAGADIFLVCHNEQAVWECYESVFKAAESDRRFAARVAEAAKHVTAFKKRCAELKRRPAPCPSEKTIEKLRCEIWELGEEARLAANSMEPQGTQRTQQKRGSR